MAHFGVIAPAFYSHFSALTALAIELHQRGHRVTFFHRPDAADFIDDARIEFHALGADRFPPGSLAASLKRAANPGSPLGLHKVILDMADTTDMFCRELPDALEATCIDAILGDQMEAAAGLVAEAMGIPFISIACALPVNREAGIPLPVMPFQFGSSESTLKMYKGSTDVYDWIMAPHRRVIKHHSSELGIPTRGMLHECLSSLAQISQTTASFDFPRLELPPHFYHVGPLRRSASLRHNETATDHHINDILNNASGRPLVFASLGTLQGHRFGLFKRIAKACRTLDTQLLVAHCGGLSDEQARVIERSGPMGATTVCEFAPQQAVLARADAVITHAGLNTVMDAVATRTPILALPIAFDQPGVAARIFHAGIGLRASARFATRATLSSHLRQLLSNPSYGQQLGVLADDLALAGGSCRAADIVEMVLRLTAHSANDARPVPKMGSLA